MNNKNRFIIGIISIIGSIAIGITFILGSKENLGMSISLSYISLLFMWMGVGQIVFSYILKNKEK